MPLDFVSQGSEDTFVDPATGLIIYPARDAMISEFSSKLLTDFYLRPHETPQQGYARAAKAWSGGDAALAQRLYDGASQGWFMFASPVLSNAPLPGESLKGMPISCLTGDMPINTYTGIKWMKDIRVGDQVLTHKGRFRSVEAIQTRESHDLYELVVSTRPTRVKITGNHPVLTNLGWVRVDELDSSRDLVAVNGEVDFQIAYCPIRSLNKLSQSEVVYDIQVDEDESFSVAGIIVHNCFLSFTSDSLQGLIDHTVESRWLAVLGGGIGGHWRNVRAVSDKAPGPIPFMHTIDADMEAYKQGKVRRGSYAAYLDIDHPDILEFLNIRLPTGDISRKCHSAGFHHGVNITDDFMRAVVAGAEWQLRDPHDKTVRESMPARALWEQILEVRYRTGEPYLYFIDTARRAMPASQKALGLELHGSNLCVAPETQVLTDKGYFPIASLEGQEINVWNGTEWSATVVHKTGTAQPLVKVLLSDGSSLDCTPYHKFYVQRDAVYEVRANDLRGGDVLENWTNPNGGSVVVITVVAVENCGRIDDTYCFNEPLRHKGIFNGILTGNCSEITLPTNEQRTAVCCLSSLNAETYDAWKHTNIVQDLVEMLDNVLDYFIEHAPQPLARAKFSAMRERSLGLGLMGFHAYLQQHNVAFGSKPAQAANKSMFAHVQREAIAASLRLGGRKGEAPDMIGTGRRNAVLTAIAPNANSAILLGTSPSVEPISANAYVHQTRAGSWPVKNRYLKRLLIEKDMNTDEVWQDIIINRGSVQHLDFLSDEEKAIFKTAIEIDQMWLVQHAADRQPYVCQSQSINLFFPPRAERSYINRVHLAAWQKGLKSLYYMRTDVKNRTEAVSKKIERVALRDGDETAPRSDCTSCQG